jgi:hypothetical protein
MPIDNGARYDREKDRIYREYTAIMTYPFLALRFGEKHTEVPYEEKESYLRTFVERVVWQVTEFSDFILHCLRGLPWYLADNPIQIQSAHYEEPVRDKTQGEMVDIMAQELMNLPRFTAYAKIIQERLIKQGVFIHKLNTSSPMKVDRHDLSIATNNGHKMSEKRTDIEAEIRERQKKWRGVTPQVPNSLLKPPTPKPPPTSD